MQQPNKPHQNQVLLILNITPDSFSDGGFYFNHPEQVADTIRRALAAGVRAIDVGAQSTAPGKTPISADEEMKRLEDNFFSLFPKVINPLEIPNDFIFSIDSFRVETVEYFISKMREWALFPKNEIWWNDVSGLYRSALPILEKYSDLKYICCHNLVPVREETPNHQKFVTDILELSDVISFFRSALEFLPKGRVICDPALGFAKSRTQNLNILEKFNEIVTLLPRDVTWIVAISRKSFLRDPGRSYQDPGQAELVRTRESEFYCSLKILQKYYIRTHSF